ncbi:hypothetical protein [Brevibacillus laterosporus]|nr:hypothetical protein [Brevibacillus laterosporus]MDN9011560.1 hypothetical protein [Brevibacillus laterosporus]MDO0942616.1 hypothetical protein [Brevibacillus laterosporus]
MQMTTEKTVGEKIIQLVADETELDRDKAKTCIRSFVGAGHKTNGETWEY